jgi:hypothetical protein
LKFGYRGRKIDTKEIEEMKNMTANTTNEYISFHTFDLSHTILTMSEIASICFL